MKAPLKLLFDSSIAQQITRRQGIPPGFFHEHSFSKASWIQLANGQVTLQEFSGNDYAFWQWNFKTEGVLECFVEAEYGTIVLLQPIQVFDDVLYIEGRVVHLWPKMYLFFYMPMGTHKLSISGPSSFYIFLQPPLSFLEGLKGEIEGITELCDCYLQGSKQFYFLPAAPILEDNWMRLKKTDVPSLRKGIPDLYLRNYIIDVLHDYVKTVKEQPSSHLLFATTKHKAVLLREYLDEHLTDPALYNLATIEKKFYAEPRSLNRAFRNLTGKSIMQYIIDQRLEKARVYIVETTLPVKDIVFLCGYTDVSHFIRIFQKRYGITPGRMRENKEL